MARRSKSSDVRDIGELIPDSENARRRTSRSRDALAHSIETMGLGRSVLIDRDDNVVAGNGTLEAATAAGVTKVRVIETDGTELIAVKRTNLEGLQSKAMAIADNRTAELATWDIEQLDRTLSELDEAEFVVDDLGFDETDLGDLFGDLDNSLMLGETEDDEFADDDEDDQQDDGWRFGDPPKRGYYLATWVRDEKRVVSELWFNPNSSGPCSWHSTRGYLSERRTTAGEGIRSVLAWKPMPKPWVDPDA
ncbi:MAG: hypothetical protein Fues2KO_52070 [Fuerstiella sp.]